MKLRSRPIIFKSLIAGIIASMFSYICMQRDWALSIIPLVMASAIYLCFGEQRKYPFGVAMLIHLALSYIFFGIGFLMLWIDLGFVMSMPGFSLMSAITGCGILLGNSIVFKYQRCYQYVLLGIIVFASLPWIANQIMLINRNFNVFWIFLLLWQITLMVLMCLCIYGKRMIYENRI